MPSRSDRTRYSLRACSAFSSMPRTRTGCTLVLLVALLLTLPASPLAARDILRGGAGTRTSAARNEARAQAGSQAAQATQLRAQDRLARTTQVVNQMRALQASARAAARVNTIPNGLADGGLKVLAGPNARWEGANQPVAQGSLVRIRQTDPQATLHWETFHVGEGTTVRFDQSQGGTDSGKWIAFNKVFDPAAKPSQIRGKIQADGQVYILNRNGVVFGSKSQVNARTLVASALPLNDNLVNSGLLNNKDAQFLFSGLTVPGGADGTPVFTPDPLPVGGRYGDISVEQGALIQTPASSDGNGGRIVLAGANVLQSGDLQTPAGQTILAAGLQVGFRAHPESDPSLRGLDVWIGEAGAYGGTVLNSGIVTAETGSITLAGKIIRQAGVLESTTSVNLNGRIDLLASYGAVGNPNFDRFSGSTNPPFFNQLTGTVQLAPGSTTRILPDYASTKKIPGSVLAQKSQVNIEGLAVHLDRDSSLMATSGDIRIRAGIWPFKDTDGDGTTLAATGSDQQGLNLQLDGGVQRFLHEKGRVHISTGALLDASGTPGAEVPLDQYLLTVQLRGSELADSPLQRKSGLRGKPLFVDLRRSGTYGGREWIGTPLGDLTGLANITERSVAELTTRGGNIRIAAGEAFVLEKAATIDVSGGFFQHQGGFVRTTRLLSKGRLIDIHNATPEVAYDGVYEGQSTQSSVKWGVERTFAHPLALSGGGNQPSYVEGASAGSLSITAPQMALAGNLLGQSITGPYQQTTPAARGALALAFRSEQQLESGPGTFVFLNKAAAPPQIVLSRSESARLAPAFSLMPSTSSAIQSADPMVLPARLWDDEEGGFGSLVVDNSEGDILLPESDSLQLPSGFSITLLGRNIDLLGSLKASGGYLSAIAYNYTPIAYAEQSALGAFAARPAPLPIAGQGSVRVGGSAVLDLAGDLIDERPSSLQPYASSYLLTGGTVSLTGYEVEVEKNALIDVSGGVLASQSGRVSYGAAGSISLLAGRDPLLATTSGGKLQLEGTLLGFSGSKGGSLAVQAPLIEIGRQASVPGAMLLTPEFFNRGGFTQFALTGLGAKSSTGAYLPGVKVAAGSTIAPVAENWIYQPLQTSYRAVLLPGSTRDNELMVEQKNSLLATQSNPDGARRAGIKEFSGDLLTPGLLPAISRSATSISLTATGYDDAFTEDTIEALGLVQIEPQAVIRTEPAGSIRITANLLTVEGELHAPGGTIELAGASAFRVASTATPSVTAALPTVFLGSKAVLSTAGTAIPYADLFDWNGGTIHPGGTIKISGNIVALAGSELNASGTSGIFDVHPAYLSGFEQSATPDSRSGLNTRPVSLRRVATRIDSDGGRIELTGSQMLYVDSNLRAEAGGPTAYGGTLSVFSGRYYNAADSRKGSDTNLMVASSASADTVVDMTGLADFASEFFITATPDSFLRSSFATGFGNPGIGFFSLDRFTSGGFDHLDLGYRYFENASPIPFGGNVEFMDAASLEARGSVRLAGGGVVRASQPVRISAPYVAIGQEFRAPLNPSDPFQPFREFNAGTGGTPALAVAPTAGTGSLRVDARFIDVGTLVTQGLGSLTLSAPGGDIRGNGILNVAGDIVMESAQIYPTTLARFDVFAFDPAVGKGSVTTRQSGSAEMPFSAGGSLRLFASQIRHEGTLRAPMGSITLGWDGSADSKPANPVVEGAASIPGTLVLEMKNRSEISVSGIDPSSGREIVVPFGLTPDGLAWIDPRGVDVTVAGLPSKSVTLSAGTVQMDPEAHIDLRGGGNLFAYRWIPGVGGSLDLLGTANLVWSSAGSYTAGSLVSHAGKTWSARRDIDASDFVTAPVPSESRYWALVPESYAILPGLSALVSPFNAFNTGVNSGSLGGDSGFSTSGFRVGDRLELPSAGGASTSHLLLPRRFALLPEAVLIAPQSGFQGSSSKVRTFRNPLTSSKIPKAKSFAVEEGSVFVPGRLNNGLQAENSKNPLLSRFEFVPSDVLAGRVKFDLFSANEFFPSAAERLELSTLQSLPRDAGALQIHAASSMLLSGRVSSQPAGGGRGAAIDLSSDAPILVGTPGLASPGSSLLNVEILNSWRPESLVIGGLRRSTPSGMVLDVRAPEVVLANGAAALAAPDTTLAASGRIDLRPGSSIQAEGQLTSPALAYSIAGDGALVRVSQDSSASIQRSATTDAEDALVQIGASATLSGRAVLIDSSRAASISESVRLSSSALTLGSGQISIAPGQFAPDLTGSVVGNHLVLSGRFAQTAFGTGRLSLQSYRTIDWYAADDFTGQLKDVRFSASGLRVFGSGDVLLNAGSLLLENSQSAVALPSPGLGGGTLSLSASTLRIGDKGFAIGGPSSTTLSASQGIRVEGAGTFSAAGDLAMRAPSISAARGASQTIASGGNLNILSLPGSSAFAPELGARLAFEGASVNLGSRILLPSGSIEANASTGDVVVSGTLFTEGTGVAFYDVNRFADAGDIRLKSTIGRVELQPGSLVSVAAASGGGNAGTLEIRSPSGLFVNNGVARGDSRQGLGGIFVLDAGSVASFDDLQSDLARSGFSQSQDLRIRSGDVQLNGVIQARDFSLSADEGSILVQGRIDASGATGGRISLMARNSLALLSGAELTVAGLDFNNAGKGGQIQLQSGASSDGQLDTNSLLEIQNGALLDLSVAAYQAGDYLSAGSSAFQGRFQGSLHLRAPRVGNEVAIAPLAGSIEGASVIAIEPVRVYEPALGTMNIALRNGIHTDNSNFMNAAEVAIRAFIVPADLDSSTVVTPGVEILNRAGPLTLGLANNAAGGSTNAEALAGADWDLSSYRYGSRNSPGVLTLRASGDVIFNNTLSDGFTPVAEGSATNFADRGHSRMWLATPQTIDANLPLNLQSWSYRIAAGADAGSSNPLGVKAGTGSVLVGEIYPAVPNQASSGTGAALGRDGQTADTIRISTTTTNRGTRYEVVRTGTGDIEIASGLDVQLRNPFSTIYTAGIALPTSTRIFSAGDFSVPIVVRASQHPDQGGTLGAVQQPYAATYSFSGGNLRIFAGQDLGRFTQVNNLTVPDASRQLPTHWLYRRGQVDPATGLFSSGGVGTGGLGTFTDPSASTTWWIDHTNFFSGLGALAGGQVVVSAGRDVVNLDVAIPTTARMAGIDAATSTNLRPDVANLLEHGGGDLVLTSGRDLNGGTFYVEKGEAFLRSGGDVTTNESNSPSRGRLATVSQTAEVFDPLTWLPVTLFGGRSQFTVNARGDVLIGPATSAFLLPQGLNNKFWYKTQFQTMDASASLKVNAFGGGITHRLGSTLYGDSLVLPVLETAYRQSSAITPSAAGYFRPWLRFAETNLSNFRTAASIALPTLHSTAFAGDVNVVGNLNLAPSPSGSLELLASGAVNGLNPTGKTRTTLEGVDVDVTAWASAVLNLSDADPVALPGISSPVSIQALLGSRVSNDIRDASISAFSKVNPLFAETGSFSGTFAAIDFKSSLHASKPVHSSDPDPVRLYAGEGDLSGVTLYSAKKIRSFAQRDITDVALYFQHVAPTDVSVVSAGRDILPFNENSPVRALASSLTQGNLIVDASKDTVVLDASNSPVATKALAGDIQVGGQGLVELLAGRHIDLGTGANFVDGTGTGITSIGRARNPFLPFDGASFLLAAGIGGGDAAAAIGLSRSAFNIVSSGSDGGFEDHESRASQNLREFFLNLRDIGEKALETKDYSDAYAEANRVFASTREGGVFSRARDIRTSSGGAITILAPGGDVIMASDIFGNPLTPPGIVTEYGGEVSIFTQGDVEIGQARIFTLRGGDLTIWSSYGNIAAGNAPKTVVTAPPTRVLIDVNSADIQTDLGGLATGGGIGVLASVEGVKEGAVTLLAPEGIVDAGDAGIRATGDIKIAAAVVVNADNIAAGGTAAGVPTSPSVAAPNVGGLTSGNSNTAATSSAASQVTQQSAPQDKTLEESPSLISVEVLGYGGGEGDGGESSNEEDEAEG